MKGYIIIKILYVEYSSANHALQKPKIACNTFKSKLSSDDHDPEQAYLYCKYIIKIGEKKRKNFPLRA